MTKTPTIDELKTRLHMKPHPEGGFYAETFRDTTKVECRDRIGAPMNASTGIYFLLTSNCLSHLHKLAVSSEMWHHYMGVSITIVELEKSTDGTVEMRETILGKDVLNGEVLQYVVKPGVWFGSYPNTQSETEYALVGCTVAPGFDFSDFELAKYDDLLKFVGQDATPDILNMLKKMSAE
jgi:hypothetical protein